MNNTILWQSIIIYSMDHQTKAGGLFILKRVVFMARRTVPQLIKNTTVTTYLFIKS